MMMNMTATGMIPARARRAVAGGVAAVVTGSFCVSVLPHS